MMPELSLWARSLRCAADGRVIMLSELADKKFARRLAADGYAVKIKRLRAIPQGAGVLNTAKRLLLSLVQPPEYVEIVAPADGVVTAVGEFLSLRTGDGIEISLHHGIPQSFLPAVGEKIRRGEVVCIARRSLIQQNRLGGAVAVIFTKPQQITELHVLTGKRRAGERTAFYKRNQ